MWRLKLYRGTWCATRRTGGKTQRASLHTKDRDEAERRLKDHFGATPAGDLISDIMPRYIADKKEQGARSWKAMKASWKALESTFGHLHPKHVNRLLCRSYAMTRRKGGVKDGTIIKDLGVLRAGLKWAKMDREATFEFPATPPARDRYITRQELDKLVKGCEAAHAVLFVHLAWATAGRASAILELTWDRVDFLRGQIRLSKGDGRQKGRATVPMTDTVRKALETAYKGRTCPFVIEWGGKPIKSVTKAFRRACERSGLSGVTPHILRHSAAVKMAIEGVDLHKIGQFLGHTDPRVTYRTYAKFRPEHMADAKAALE